jgi:hypothetical protein
MAGADLDAGDGGRGADVAVVDWFERLASEQLGGSRVRGGGGGRGGFEEREVGEGSDEEGLEFFEELDERTSLDELSPASGGRRAPQSGGELARTSSELEQHQLFQRKREQHAEGDMARTAALKEPTQILRRLRLAVRTATAGGGGFYEGATRPSCAAMFCPDRDSPYKREWGEEE